MKNKTLLYGLIGLLVLVATATGVFYQTQGAHIEYVTVRELAKEISSISTVSSTDTLAVLEALLATIPKELSKGNIVELGDFGSFWLKSNAEGADTAEAVRASQINTLLPRFNPGKEFKKVLDAIEFEKA